MRQVAIFLYRAVIELNQCQCPTTLSIQASTASLIVILVTRTTWFHMNSRFTTHLLVDYHPSTPFPFELVLFPSVGSWTTGAHREIILSNLLHTWSELGDRLGSTLSLRLGRESCLLVRSLCRCLTMRWVRLWRPWLVSLRLRSVLGLCCLTMLAWFWCQS
jgi:hypothetical protein